MVDFIKKKWIGAESNLALYEKDGDVPGTNKQSEEQRLSFKSSLGSITKKIVQVQLCCEFSETAF